MLPPFTQIKSIDKKDAKLDDWFRNNNATAENVVDIIDDEDDDDDDDEHNLVIDLEDIPMSCENDLFSDQYVDKAAQDILNMDVIFDDSLDTLSLTEDQPNDLDFGDNTVDNLNVRSIASIKKEKSLINADNQIKSVAVNDVIYYNTNTMNASTDNRIVSVTNEGVVYLVAEHVSIDPTVTHASPGPQDEYAIYDVESTTMSPEHVPDIEQQIADPSEDSQHSHSSSNSATSLEVCVHCF